MHDFKGNDSYTQLIHFFENKEVKYECFLSEVHDFKLNVFFFLYCEYGGAMSVRFFVAFSHVLIMFYRLNKMP